MSKGASCTDPDCRAPHHGDGQDRPALRCYGCHKRIDNPLCAECQGRVQVAAVEIPRVLKLKTTVAALERELAEAVELLKVWHVHEFVSSHGDERGFPDTCRAAQFLAKHAEREGKK